MSPWCWRFISSSKPVRPDGCGWCADDRGLFGERRDRYLRSRIRENIQAHARRSLLENVNISLNETLSRSINTSFATMFSLVGILVFGTDQILNFAIAMMIGIIAATISSTFVATTGLLLTSEPT